MKTLKEFSDLQLAMMWDAITRMEEDYQHDDPETGVVAMDITLSIADEITNRYPMAEVELWVLERTPYVEKDSMPDYPFQHNNNNLPLIDKTEFGGNIISVDRTYPKEENEYPYGRENY